MDSYPSSPEARSARGLVIEAWIREVAVAVACTKASTSTTSQSLKRKRKASTTASGASDTRAPLSIIDSNMDRSREPKTPKAKAANKTTKTGPKTPAAKKPQRPRGRAASTEGIEEELRTGSESSRDVDSVDEQEEEEPTPRLTKRLTARRTRSQGQHPEPSIGYATKAKPPPCLLPKEIGYAASLEMLCLDPPGSTTQTQAQGSETSSRRSKSPVKSMADLHFAAKPVVTIAQIRPEHLSPDIQQLCEELGDIHSGDSVIPSAVFSDVVARAKAFNAFERVKEQHKNAEDTRPAESARQELQSLCAIVRESKRADATSFSEAHWNARVHSPLLVTAIEADQVVADSADSPAVEVFDTTVASIATGCVPRHANGLDLAGKMVDFCIVLSAPEVRLAARHAVAHQKPPPRRARARGKRGAVPSSSSTSASGLDPVPDTESAAGDAADNDAGPPVPPSSINHSEYSPLRLSPIAVSIETKQPNGSSDQAKAQLSVWLSAHLLRLHQLSGTQRPVPFAFPLIYVAGSQWQLRFAVEKHSTIEVFEFIRFEGTGSLFGCYKILAMLRALRKWCLMEFQPRFLQLLSNKM